MSDELNNSNPGLVSLIFMNMVGSDAPDDEQLHKALRTYPLVNADEFNAILPFLWKELIAELGADNMRQVFIRARNTSLKEKTN